MPLLLPMAGLTPIIIEQTEVAAATPIPANVSGCWVTLVGQGGNGGLRGTVANTNQSAYGGSGGGGAAVLDRIFVPGTLLGPTYQLTAGTTTARFAKFVCGGVTLQAGWGADGGNANFGGTGGAGGVASGTGIDVTGFTHDGTAGRTGSNGSTDGLPAVDNTGGGGAGGGGGGGARSSPGATTTGGNGGVATGPLGKSGGKGGNGTGRSGNGAQGGNGGGGGGYAPGGVSGNTPATIGQGGIAYTKVEWV